MSSRYDLWLVDSVAADALRRDRDARRLMAALGRLDRERCAAAAELAELLPQCSLPVQIEARAWTSDARCSRCDRRIPVSICPACDTPDLDWESAVDRAGGREIPVIDAAVADEGGG